MKTVNESELPSEVQSQLDKLDPFQRWCVKSNVNDILQGRESLETRVVGLKSRGYPTIALTVESVVKAVNSLISLI